MKKRQIISTIIIILFIITGCNTRTYDDISENNPIPEMVKYNENVKTIIQTNCTSCHSTAGSASYYPLTNYTETKNAITSILDRIQRANGDPDKMPQNGSISQSNIDVIKKWQTDGLLE